MKKTRKKAKGRVRVLTERLTSLAMVLFVVATIILFHAKGNLIYSILALISYGASFGLVGIAVFDLKGKEKKGKKKKVISSCQSEPVGTMPEDDQETNSNRERTLPPN